jgi:F-type H+-transporting ATPase subunit delta
LVRGQKEHAAHRSASQLAQSDCNCFQLLKEENQRVDISAGIQASLSGRYASALFDLASEQGKVTAVEADLEKLSAALSESQELVLLTTNPKVSRAEAAKALDSVGGVLGLDKLTQDFLGVMASNRRVSELGKTIAAFRMIAAAQRGEVTARVTSAHKLTKEQQTTITKKLTAREGRTVKLETEVDPEILGGLVITIGSQRIDGSIRTRLNSLSQAMKA